MVGADVAISSERCVRRSFSILCRKIESAREGIGGRGTKILKVSRRASFRGKEEKEKDDSFSLPLSSLFTRTEQRWCAHATGKI